MARAWMRLSQLTQIAALAFVFHAAVARAQSSTSQDVTALRTSLTMARYPNVIESARALLRRTDLRAAERNETLEILATAQLATRANTEASATLAELYARDPEYRLADGSASPPVVAAFARARERGPARVPVSLVVSASTTEPVIQVEVTNGAHAVHQVRLTYVGPLSSLPQVSSTLDENAHAELPVRLGTHGDGVTPVPYYIEALAPSGAAIANEGTSEQPLTFTPMGSGNHMVTPPLPPAHEIVPPVDPPTERPEEPVQTLPVETEPAPPQSNGGGVLESPWFWTVVGVVVVGGGVVGGYFLFGPPSEPQGGSLGTIRL